MEKIFLQINWKVFPSYFCLSLDNICYSIAIFEHMHSDLSIPKIISESANEIKFPSKCRYIPMPQSQFYLVSKTPQPNIEIKMWPFKEYFSFIVAATQRIIANEL